MTTMLINLKKFNNKEIFDENFFLYFEEFFCKSVIDKDENVFTQNLKIHHLGFQSSLGKNLKMKKELRIREWQCGQVFIFIKKIMDI